MVVVGTDVHKRTHTFVAVDDLDRRLGQKVTPATTAGHRAAIFCAREQFGTEVLWGIEDCRNLSSRLAGDLLAADQKAVRVAPKLMAQTRASARTAGKSDPIDALAVAQAVLRHPDLPIVSHDPVSRELKLLIDRGEDLVAQRTSAINRFLGRIHELDPTHTPKKASLDRAKTCTELAAWLDTHHGLLAELARDELADIVRLNRSGNRQLNAALHRIAITQIGMTNSAGQIYYRKRLAAANSTTEALRCLKRRLSRVVHQHQEPTIKPIATPPTPPLLDLGAILAE